MHEPSISQNLPGFGCCRGTFDPPNARFARLAGDPPASLHLAAGPRSDDSRTTGTPPGKVEDLSHQGIFIVSHFPQQTMI